MRARDVIGRCIDLGLVREDIASRALTAAFLHTSGPGDSKVDGIELYVGRCENGYVYALHLVMDGDQISELRRVKFETMCGGWRSEEVDLRRFPVQLNEGEEYWGNSWRSTACLIDGIGGHPRALSLFRHGATRPDSLGAGRALARSTYTFLQGEAMDCEDALVVVRCPFCSGEIVRAYDHSMLPDDLSDEERERITIDTCDDPHGRCEHLAFRSDWAYAGSEYLEPWQGEMEKLAASVSEDPERTGPDVLAEAMIYDEPGLEPQAEKVLPEYRFASSTEYVEKFDGVRSGGPTYMHIFLQRKA